MSQTVVLLIRDSSAEFEEIHWLKHDLSVVFFHAY